MYNLLYYQIIVQTCVTLTESECDELIDKYSNNETVPLSGFNDLGSVMAFVLENTNKCRQLHTDYLTMAVNTVKRRSQLNRHTASTSSSSKSTDSSSASSTSYSQNNASKLFNLDAFSDQTEDLCLPFLRIAALLRLHLYEEQLPQIATDKDEFPKLVSFLELVTGNSSERPKAVNALYFVAGNERQLPKFWFDQIIQLNATDRIPGQKHATIALLSQQHEIWQQPRLLALPKEYEKIFTVSLPCCVSLMNFLISFVPISVLLRKTVHKLQ